jgi:hypothetical protein
MRFIRIDRTFLYIILSFLLSVSQVFAWGSDGHQTVGAIADKLIENKHAGKEVHAILGNMTLQDVAVWADCARGIDPKQNFEYKPKYHNKACEIFETKEGEAEMKDYVLRNDHNCDPQPEDNSCHTEYHYADVSIQHDHYERSYVGTRSDDVVAAIVASIHALKGEPVPSPFNIKDKREALMLLAHFVGDVHQPLHVGAVYLAGR